VKSFRYNMYRHSIYCLLGGNSGNLVSVAKIKYNPKNDDALEYSNSVFRRNGISYFLNYLTMRIGIVAEIPHHTEEER